MTRSEILAIQKLPCRFVCDGTSVHTVKGADSGAFIVAVNPKYSPIIYRQRGWRKLNMIPSPIEHSYGLTFIGMPRPKLSDLLPGHQSRRESMAMWPS